MKKIMNFIGSLLIGLAAIMSFSRTVLLFALIGGIVIGIFMVTMISLFELFGHLAPNEYSMEAVLFKKPIWDVVVVVIGGATMWLGIQKMFESDNKNIDLIKNK